MNVSATSVFTLFGSQPGLYVVLAVLAFIFWLINSNRMGLVSTLLTIVLVLLVVAWAPGRIAIGVVNGTNATSAIIRANMGVATGPVTAADLAASGWLVDVLAWGTVLLTALWFGWLILRGEWSPLWATIFVVVALGLILEVVPPFLTDRAIASFKDTKATYGQLVAPPPAALPTQIIPGADAPQFTPTPTPPPPPTPTPDPGTISYTVPLGGSLSSAATWCTSNGQPATWLEVQAKNGVVGTTVYQSQVLTCP